MWVVEAQAWYRGPFKGRVVDAETLEPIQGAVVFVEWRRNVMTPVEAQSVYYDAAEALTDEKGEFYIKKKWSWSPWRNLMMYSSVIIFKAGYGHIRVADWPRLDVIVERMHEYSLKEGKRVPPDLKVKVEFEDGLPLFLLKKLTTWEERSKNLPYTSGDVPDEKMKLLQQERDKERKALGLD